MTTIALSVQDGKLHLCADNLVTAGSARVGSTPKIFRIGKGLAAISGHMAAAHDALAWLRKGAKPKSRPVWADEVDFEVLWVKSLLDIQVVDNTFHLMPGSVPYTAGSGAEYAMAAIRLGKTAREAVALAIELDCFSGGEIDELVL